MADVDWRINAASETTKESILPWNGKVIPKGTVLTSVSVSKLSKKKILSIPVPNATALCLNISYERFKAAQELRVSSNIDKSIKKEVAFNSDKDAIDYVELVFESVIMAFTALEAFANEQIPNDFETWETRSSDVILEKKDNKEIERFSSTLDKFHRILPEILKVESPKGTKCWQDLKSLKSIRDRIIHMKSEDRLSSGPEVKTLWNSIFKLEKPYKQALSVINYFSHSSNIGSWYGKCPFKDL